MKRTDAIKNLLLNLTHSDLAALYNSNMEVQVNVKQGDGVRTGGEYKGKHWDGWTNGEETWKPFHIPWNAATNPEYEDRDINFNLALHAQGIGLTGWDWYNKQSLWVAFDFDSIIGHKEGLSINQLNLIEEEATKIPWVTLRRSTSGSGLHLYVFLNTGPTTKNHTEHKALARAILGQLAAETGFDFTNDVDACGGNMWIWHEKMTEENGGLKLIKQGEPLYEYPVNWRDHIKVVSGRRRKNLPQIIEDQTDSFEDIDRMFSELTGQYVREQLDETHKKLLSYLKENDCYWWWDQDNNMLVTHTIHLKEAHTDLNLKGIFNTISTGRNRGNDHNCFAFPLRRGGWVVRRFSPGVKEHNSWDQDSSGWTRCYLNIKPNLSTASRNYEGTEHPSGGYVFRLSEDAQKAAFNLGIDLDLPNWALSRPTKLKQHKDGRLIVEVDKENSDNPEKMTGWIPEGRTWKRIFNTNLQQPLEWEQANYDDLIRHITVDNINSGWVVCTNGNWIEEPLTHVKLVLKSMKLPEKDVSSILGSNIFKHWTIVNEPFQPEYPGDRKWNRNACQLRYYPSKSDNLHYPTWLKILNQVGKNLTPALKDFDWAKNNGILTGADYLKCWIASVFQQPFERLPYLFLFGPESSGKSLFHEALSLLVTSSGYTRAERAILSDQGFNSELKNAIFCVIEETDLSKNTSVAHARIKDYSTSILIQIHPKGSTPYLVKNVTHWIHCSNNISYVPCFTGDTRIVMIRTDPLVEWEAKPDIIKRLCKEAPDFLGSLYSLKIPKSTDRLYVPVITTSEKSILQEQNKNSLEQFIEEQCFHAPGYMIKLSDFYSAFMKWLDPAEATNWSKHRIGKSLNLPYVKGRNKADQQFYLGNISFEEPTEKRKPLTIISNRLVVIDV